MATFTQNRCNVRKNLPIHPTNQIINVQIIYSMKKSIPTLITVWLLWLASIQTMAQQRVVTGTVLDSEGLPIAGASIVVKGTTTGTVTDADGTFSLNVNPDVVLVFQFIGYEAQEIPVGNMTSMNVTLQESVTELEGVVVTALGLTREEESLGYSVSKVGSEDITQVQTNNWLSTMNGRVAGLTLNTASSGPISSMRVTLRGDQSLNYGANEALFVIDGIPVRSGTTATSSSSSYTNSGADFPVDYGNGASDLNPEDIESITVLKGPSATALYGSRAANGAIVITTKSGRNKKGIGVTVNSTVAFEKAGYWPDFQKEYGAGADKGQNEFNFWTLDPSLVGGATDFPPRNISRYAWGEKFEGQLRYQYEGKNWETGQIERTPFVYQDDWFTGIFKTGVTYTNTVDVSGSNGEGTNVRLSLNQNKNEWILPNTGFDRKNISFSLESPVNKWIKFKTKVNYYNTTSDNMPMAGYHQTTVMYDLMWGYNNSAMKNWRDEYFLGRFNEINRKSSQSQNGNSLVVAGTGSYNPYRILYDELNSMDKDRVFGFAGFSVDMGDLLKGLTFDVKSGLDMSTEFRTQRKPHMTARWQNGFYREESLTDFESNTDFLFKYDGNIVSKLSLVAGFGGNNMVRVHRRNRVQLNELDIPGVYHIDNVPSGVFPDPTNYRSKKVINSLYGFTTFGWDDKFYLDFTARNDWSSTLAPDNWSYFYPSVSASVLLDRVFDLPSVVPAVSLAKIRLSWANVGNDTDPYSLGQYYSATSISGGYSMPSNITNPLIRPENVESWEFGLDARFLQNRLGLDVALYNSSTTDQIIDVAVDPIVGASSMKINAGEINNKGIEVSLSATPVKTTNFSWDINVNWAKNKTTLVSLQDGWDPTTPLQTNMGTTIGGRLFVHSYIGEEMYQLYGFGLKRAPEGSYYLDANGNRMDASGQVIIDPVTGLPSLTTDPDVHLGKVNPDWRGGFSTSFRYKNFAFNALFTYQWGGRRFSVTDAILSYQGKLTNSLKGRYDGIVAEGLNAVSTDENGAGEYQLNNTVTSNIYTYYQARTLDRYNGEAHTYNTTFLKFKEARLTYTLPSSLVKKTKVLQGASIAVFATNIFSWDEWPQFDPEGGMLTGSNIFTGIEAGAFPMTRTQGVNVRLSF
jgi:TonB-linked SusC/RagA family outer membrane protein